jgi:hypothetical protein
MNINKNLHKLNKSELLKIISKMKKDELIEIIDNKIGGGNSNIIKETKNAIRRTFPIDHSKISNINDKLYINNSMANDVQYNKMYKKYNDNEK